MTRERKEELIAAMNASREETLRLLDWVIDESTTRSSPGAGFRPILWHLAHVGVFEEWWLLNRVLGLAPINPHYQVIFDPIKTPREESNDLPSRREIEEYLSTVRSEVELHYARSKRRRAAQSGEWDESYVLNLVLEHEYQHQETLSYLLQMLPPQSKLRPAGEVKKFVRELPQEIAEEMVSVEGGEFVRGADETFSYDNELPARFVEVEDFKLDRLPVTNAQYLAFVEDGGYQNRTLWCEAGWKWKEENRVSCPHYWKKDDVWQSQEMFEVTELRRGHPVTGVSWFEAEAFARYAGKRLPTEIEWEKAAAHDPQRHEKRRFPWGNERPSPGLCNFGGHFMGTTRVGSFPEGASASGAIDMAGNVWEWTSSTFDRYPGFKAYPYPEYSEIWFDGDHRVLKGGSWMTRAPLLRASFRNFFRPGFRYAFAGFRCAR